MTDPQTVDLTKICIRVQIASPGSQGFSGHWESLTLQEALDAHEGGQIAKWFMQKITDIIDLHEAEEVQAYHVKNMIAFLENNGITIVKLK